MSEKWENRTQSVWLEKSEIPGESLLSGLWKFSLVNAMAAPEMMRLLFDLQLAQSRSTQTHPRSFLVTSWVPDLARPSQRWLGRVLAGNIKRPAAVLTNLATDRCIRFCKDCLSYGAHYWEFQIEALRLCPIHMTPLSETCPACKMQTARYALCEEAFASPYHCFHCGQPLSKRLGISDLVVVQDVLTDALKKLNPLRKWLGAVFDLNLTWDSAQPPAILAYQQQPEVERKRMYTAAALCLSPTSRKLARVFEVGAAWMVRRISVVNAPPHSSEYVHREESFNSKVAIYKSIKRNMYKRFCLHRNCLATASYGGLFGSLNGNTLPSANECVWAQTWMHWRAQYEDMSMSADLWNRGQRNAGQRTLFSSSFRADDVDDSKWAWSVYISLHDSSRTVRSWVASRWRLLLSGATDSRGYEFRAVSPAYLSHLRPHRHIPVNVPSLTTQKFGRKLLRTRVVAGSDETAWLRDSAAICIPIFQ